MNLIDTMRNPNDPLKTKTIFSFGFQLMKNNETLELFTNEKKIYTKWRALLVARCVLQSFHDDYLVIKMIGKGSFAKVYTFFIFSFFTYFYFGKRERRLCFFRFQNEKYTYKKSCNIKKGIPCTEKANKGEFCNQGVQQKLLSISETRKSKNLLFIYLGVF